MLTRQIAVLLVNATLLFILAEHTRGDSWALPETTSYCSANKKYCLEVVPKRLESTAKYWEDKATGKEDAGGLKGEKDNFCKGTLFELRAPKPSREVWTTRLTNEIAPVDALVSDSGRYVVTFDNWHSIGYGDDVVVIYGPKGQLVKEFSLEELLGEDAQNIEERSISSRRWWKQDKPHYIDEAAEILILRAAVIRIIRPATLVLKAKYSELTRGIRVSLKDGQILSSQDLPD